MPPLYGEHEFITISKSVTLLNEDCQATPRIDFRHECPSRSPLKENAEKTILVVSHCREGESELQKMRIAHCLERRASLS